MNRARAFIPSALVAILAVACGGEKEDTSSSLAQATGTTSDTAVAPGAPATTGPTGVAPTMSATITAPGAIGGDTAGSTGGDTAGSTAGDTAGSTAGDTAAPQATSPLPPASAPPDTTAMPDTTAGPTGTPTTEPTASATGGAGGAPEVPPMVTTPPAEPAKPEPVLITSGENSFWQEGEVTDAAGANADVTVNDTSVLQDWHGFGGTFNEKGWEALAKLSQEDRDLALKMLFDKNDGAAFTYGRIPIGSSDYARDRYSLAPTAGDFEMADFSIDRDKEELIPYIKAAMAVNPDIKFWGSPWSPPPWMKDNNAFDRGNMKNDADTLKAHALYLSRFVEDYGKEGINILAVHPQNEPGFGQDYPSCGWSGSQMADYIANYLGPTFEERSITAEIWMGTMSNDQVDSGIAQTVMGNAAAKAYIKGMGLQWGMEKFAQQYVNDYDVPIFQTEHRCGNYPWEGNYKADKAPNDFAYALESWDLLTGWITKGVNGYSAWNMVLDTKGASLDTVRPWNQNALLIVDTAAGKLIPTPTYYVFRHLAQYVEPGAVRVATQGGNALAFKNPDGSIVTVLHATGSQAATTTLSVAGKSLQFSIPARGWATVNVQPE